MSLVLPSTISSSNLNQLLHVNRKSECLPPLSVGEVLQAEVVEKTADKNVLILLKNAMVRASSDLMFAKDGKISVRVERLHPAIVLRILSERNSGYANVNDFVKLYRSKPNALIDNVLKGIEYFSQIKSGELIEYLGKDNIDKIQRSLVSLIFSKASVGKNLFFRDYVYNSGFLMEKMLRKIADRRFGKNNALKNVSHTLKALLIKVSSNLMPVIESGDSPEAERLARFVNSFLMAIESQQVANSIFQEYDNKYVFQIPIQFPENIETADVIVKYEDNSSGHSGQKNRRNIIIFLNTDVLGELCINTEIFGKKIRCVVQCGEEKAQTLITAHLRQLGEKLMNLGFAVDYLHCVVEKEISNNRKNCRDFENYFDCRRVNILA